MRVLYFAWVRTRIGKAAEDIVPPKEVGDVAALITWLRSQGPGYEAALGNASIVRAAVNREHVKHDHPVSPADEIAFFPPVTGG